MAAKPSPPTRPAILDTWDEIQLDPLTIPPDDFSGLSLEAAVEQITDWFFVNFEDPANSTPYESAEGGYQYIWGGPYDARDIIENIFADTASDELITAAIAAVEQEGYEWAPHDRRIQPPDDEPPDIVDRDALHAEMLRRIAELERALDEASTPGIGHNRPPEAIDEIPLDPYDQQDIRRSLAILKEQPPAPSETAIPALEAEAGKLDSYGKRILTWFAERADDFATEAVKEAGKEFGKWGARVTMWKAIGGLLTAAAVATNAWLHAFF